MSRVAAIDIGTNSTRLLVAERSGEGLKVLETKLIITRLGEGIGQGVLLPGAMERTIEAVSSFYQIALSLGAERVVAVATSAVRDASNQGEFIDMVKQRTGLQVQVLSGEEEAALSYWGALSGLAIKPRSTAVVDIGGGSTEFIWMQAEQPRLVSVNVGAVRMTMTGQGEEEVATLLKPVLEEIKRLQVKNLVGVGGTVTTLAAIDQGLVIYDPERVHGYCLTARNVDRILKMLKGMDVEERKRVPGLQPERADIIVAGVTIVRMIMDGLELIKMLISECDILYGLALKEVEIK